MPARSIPAVSVECVTCHRGASRPTTLARTLASTIEASGIDSAVAQYRALRRDEMTFGKYDFGEWSMNELARQSRVQGKGAEAIRILELNSEFNPSSASIDMMLADLYRERGDPAKALQRYRLALEKQPNNPIAKRRVEELAPEAAVRRVWAPRTTVTRPRQRSSDASGASSASRNASPVSRSGSAPSPDRR